MYSVYQPWDPLKVCIVGRSYPPEFYSWISNPRVRKIWEKIAIETEEDFQTIIKKLEEFGVTVLRPNVIDYCKNITQIPKPPVTPRDHMVMIGNVLYSDIATYDFGHFYYNIREKNWPHCNSLEDLNSLPQDVKHHCLVLHEQYIQSLESNGYQHIFNHLKEKNNIIKTFLDPHITGPMVSRIGKDLYFGTYNDSYTDKEISTLKDKINSEFTQTRNHVVNTGGHSDGTYCPICPGLILSLCDVPTYENTYPGWEVVYLPPSRLNTVKKFAHAKTLTQGRWWIPGFENDQDLVDLVENYMSHWTGFVEETVFDVNILNIDSKNVLVYNYNKQVFDILDRYGITPHVIPFRHRYFWDGGMHCITNDLDRQGQPNDYFPERNNV